MQYTPADLPRIAGEILAAYGTNRVFALLGELGAGKTTLVAEMCRQLGVVEPTSSPTFSIVNEYRGAAGPIFHLDCYRLESVEEAISAGLEEIFMDAAGPIFVEWPAVIEPLLPEDTVVLRLGHVAGGAARELTLTSAG